MVAVGSLLPPCMSRELRLGCQAWRMSLLSEPLLPTFKICLRSFKHLFVCARMCEWLCVYVHMWIMNVRLEDSFRCQFLTLFEACFLFLASVYTMPVSPKASGNSAVSNFSLATGMPGIMGVPYGFLIYDDSGNLTSGSHACGGNASPTKPSVFPAPVL